MNNASVGRYLREPRQVIAALRVLVLAGLVMLGVSQPPEDPFLFWFLTSVYGATNLGYLWARNRDFALRRVKWLVFLFDVTVVSMLILMSGGERVQSFMTAYFGLVLMAAIADGLGHALLNAILVAVVHAVLTKGDAPLHSLLSFSSLSQFVFFFVVALFMGHVAEEARREASERSRAVADKHRVQQVLISTSSELRASTAELRAARESLRASDRLATLGMFSAGIAHELKNPLAAISSSLQSAPEILDEIEAGVETSDRIDAPVRELRAIVDDCGVACEQLRRVARDLTDLVRGGASQSICVRPGEALDGAARILRGRVKGALRMEVSVETERSVRADPGRLLQVLLNLGGNALDAMEGLPRGGLLRLRVQDADDAHVAFVVEDTGLGLPAEVQARMFEPFLTTKGPGKGTGLGLHLVGEIVTAMSGRITWDSRTGEGTRFRVEVPVAVESITPETLHDPRGQDHSDRGRRREHPQGAGAHVAARAV